MGVVLTKEAEPTPTVTLELVDPRYHTLHYTVSFDYTWNRRTTVPAFSKVTAVYTDSYTSYGFREVTLAFKAPHDAWNRRLGRAIALGRMRKGKNTLLVLNTNVHPAEAIKELIKWNAPSRWKNVEVLDRYPEGKELRPATETTNARS